MKKNILIFLLLTACKTALSQQPSAFKKEYEQYKKSKIKQILNSPELKAQLKEAYKKEIAALPYEEQQSYDALNTVRKKVKQEFDSRAANILKEEEMQERIRKRQAAEQKTREAFVRHTPFESDLDLLWYPEIDREEKKAKQAKIDQWITFKNNALKNPQYKKDAEAIIQYEKMEPSRIDAVIENLIEQDFVKMKEEEIAQNEQKKLELQHIERQKQESRARALTAAEERKLKQLKSFISEADTEKIKSSLIEGWAELEESRREQPERERIQAERAKERAEKREAAARAITAKEQRLWNSMSNWFAKTKNALLSSGKKSQSKYLSLESKNIRKAHKATEQSDIMATLQNLKEGERAAAEETAWDLYKNRPKFKEKALESLIKQGKAATDTHVDIEAERLAKRSYNKLQQLRQNPPQMFTPIPSPVESIQTQRQPTWGQRVSKWWSGVKQQPSNAQQVPYKIWLMRPR